MNFARVLDDVRASLGTPPRKLPSSNKVRMPWWSRTDDRFTDHIKRQNLLLREGDVVWGALVQVNYRMFTLDDRNYPGNVIRARNPNFTDPEALSSAAYRIFDVKGSRREDGSEQSLADLLADEMTAAKGLPVPRSIAGDIDCVLTEVMFERRHLPDGVVSGRIMPLLVHPTTEATIVVAHWHWPADFVARCWRGYGKTRPSVPYTE